MSIKKCLFILAVLFVVLPVSVYATDGEYSIDFDMLNAKTYTVNDFKPYSTNGIVWKSTSDIVIVGDETNKYIAKSDKEKYLIMPDIDKYVEVSCRIKVDSIDQIHHLLNFRGGAVSDPSTYYGSALYTSNAWDGGISISASSDGTLYNPDIATLRTGWTTAITYDGNSVYVYKNEWFDVKLSYDYETNMYKIFFSDNGIDYYLVYEEKIASIVSGNETRIRSVYLSKDAYYDNIVIKYQNSEETTPYSWNYTPYRVGEDFEALTCDTAPISNSIVSYYNKCIVRAESENNKYISSTDGSNIFYVNKYPERFLVMSANVRRMNTSTEEQIKFGATVDNNAKQFKMDYGNIVADNSDTSWHSVMYIFDVVNHTRTLYLDGVLKETSNLTVIDGFDSLNSQGLYFTMYYLDVDNLKVAVDSDMDFFRINFIDGNGTVITDNAREMNKIIYNSLIYNYAENTAECSYVIALYKKTDNTLIKMSINKFKCWGTGTVVKSELPLDGIEIDNDSDYIIKCFLLKNMNDLIPLDFVNSISF